MTTITKKVLIQKISNQLGIHHNDVRNVIQTFLDQVIDYLEKGERIEFRDFGVFQIVVRKQKIGRNPKDVQQEVLIPARQVVKFIPGKKMRESIESKAPLSKGK